MMLWFYASRNSPHVRSQPDIWGSIDLCCLLSPLLLTTRYLSVSEPLRTTAHAIQHLCLSQPAMCSLTWACVAGLQRSCTAAVPKERELVPSGCWWICKLRSRGWSWTKLQLTLFWHLITEEHVVLLVLVYFFSFLWDLLFFSLIQ